MTSTAVSSHLEQISSCAASIAQLEFGGPAAFTNALLARPDITSLIRDIEVHERSLFSLAPTKAKAHGASTDEARAAKTTSQQLYPKSKTPRPTTAVAAVLGRDLHRKVKDAKCAQDPATTTRQSAGPARLRDELDVNVLLQGAEKLCAVYPMVNAGERIASLRARYHELTSSIAHYEDRVRQNGLQLETMHQRRGQNMGLEHDEELVGDEAIMAPRTVVMSAEDVAREERDISELERKKRQLEERVNGMERDLGSLGTR